jgi:hypothetical protein
LKNPGLKPQPVGVEGRVKTIHDVVRVVDFKHFPEDLGTEEDRRIWRELRDRFLGRHHADAAAQILRERGQDFLADCVVCHQYSSIDSSKPPDTWEAKLLYYADKRVAHDEVVSLRERLDEGRQRHYPGLSMTSKELEREQAVFDLEREIFSNLSFTPDSLSQLVSG